MTAAILKPKKRPHDTERVSQAYRLLHPRDRRTDGRTDARPFHRLCPALLIMNCKCFGSLFSYQQALQICSTNKAIEDNRLAYVLPPMSRIFQSPMPGHDVICKTASTLLTALSTDKNRATATANMYRNIHECGHFGVDLWFLGYASRQTDAGPKRRRLQHFAHLWSQSGTRNNS